MPNYSYIQLILNLTMPFPNFEKGTKKVILQKIPLKMTWWQNTHFKPITRTVLCCHKLSNLWLILWRHLVTLICCKANTKSTLNRSFLGECTCFSVCSLKTWIFWGVWWRTCWNRDVIMAIKTSYMVCQTTKRLTPKHIGEERAGWFTLIALMIYCDC